MLLPEVTSQYRFVVTDILGYEICELQTRYFLFFWKKIDESGPGESVQAFMKKMSQLFHPVGVPVIFKTFQP